MQKTAIIFGATGLTGSLVLEELLSNEQYSTLKLFSRKSCGIKHPKIQESIGDLFDLDMFQEEFTGDEVYICIGTTKKKTPDRSLYRKIDVGIPVAIANLCKRNGIPKLAVVSAIGANPKSSIPYNKFKGEMEEAILSLGIDYTYILRPSLIIGDRNEFRTGEKFSAVLFRIIKFLLPKKYRAVSARAIAAKMIALCNSSEPSKIIESSEI